MVTVSDKPQDVAAPASVVVPGPVTGKYSGLTT